MILGVKTFKSTKALWNEQKDYTLQIIKIIRLLILLK